MDIEIIRNTVDMMLQDIEHLQIEKRVDRDLEVFEDKVSYCGATLYFRTQIISGSFLNTMCYDNIIKKSIGVKLVHDYILYYEDFDRFWLNSVFRKINAKAREIREKMTTRDITDEDMEIVKEWVEENVPSTYCTPIDKVLDNIVKNPTSVKKISGHKNAISFDFEGRLFVIYKIYRKTWLLSGCKPTFSLVEIGHSCWKFCCKQEVLLNVYTGLLYVLRTTPCEASSIDEEHISRILPINSTPKDVAHNMLLEICCDYVTPKKVNVYDKVTQVIVVLDGVHVLMERNNKTGFLGNLRRKMMIESTDYSKYIEDDISENMFDKVFNRLIAYK